MGQLTVVISPDSLKGCLWAAGAAAAVGRAVTDCAQATGLTLLTAELDPFAESRRGLGELIAHIGAGIDAGSSCWA